MLRTKPGQGRERHRGRIVGDTDATVVMRLIELPIEHDHLAVEPLERAQTEIAVLPQAADGHRLPVDTLDERTSRGDLEQRGVLQAERIGQRSRNEVADQFASRRTMSREFVHERLIHLGRQSRHRRAPWWSGVLVTPSIGRANDTTRDLRVSCT